MDEFQTGELDELLLDARRLLGEEPEAAPVRVLTVEEPEPAAGDAAAAGKTSAYAAGETIAFAPIRVVPAPVSSARPLPWEEPDFAGHYDGPSNATHVLSASARVRNRQAERFAVRPGGEPSGQEERPVKLRRRPRREEAEPPEEDRPPKKHGLLVLLLVLAGLLALLAGLAACFAKQPVNAHGLGARKEGVSTILLAGVDEGGLRTDTLLLLSVDRKEKAARLVSIPRDTLVNGPYSVPKINSVYAVNKGGEEGIKMLRQRVGECIGFEPDGYAIVTLDGFVELVDKMGGVTFDVPREMRYDDPAQGLHIDLKAGEQKLNGEEAMWVARFRSGYAEADLKRVEVQRDLLHAAAKQWVGPKLILKAPALLKWAEEYVDTDLSPANLSWLAASLLRAKGQVETAGTLPGSAQYILGGSYYVLEPEGVAALVNRSVNPYRRKIAADDLKIKR